MADKNERVEDRRKCYVHPAEGTERATREVGSDPRMTTPANTEPAAGETPRTDSLVRWMKECYPRTNKFNGTSTEMVSAEECRFIERALTQRLLESEEVYRNYVLAQTEVETRLQQEIVGVKRDAEHLNIKLTAYMDAVTALPRDQFYNVHSAIRVKIDAALSRSRANEGGQ